MATAAGLDASPVTRQLLNGVLDDVAALCCFLREFTLNEQDLGAP
jgi:hypothetical protein